MADIYTGKEEYEFASSFYSSNLAMNFKEIVGPAFPTSFLSTRWCFVLRIDNNVMIVSLKRMDHYGPDEAVHVVLTNRTFKNVWTVSKTVPVMWSFSKGETVEMMKVNNYFNDSNKRMLIGIVTNPKRDFITVSCKLKPNPKKYYHMYEFSRDMCTLFNSPKFSDVLLCVNGEEREAHKAVLSVRTPDLKFSGKRKLDSNTLIVKPRGLSKDATNELLKFAYCAQIDVDASYHEESVLNRAAKNLGISNFEDNWRDISYSKSVTNLKYKRSYISACCNYDKLEDGRENREFEFVSLRMSWKIKCSFTLAKDEKEHAHIRLTCDQIGDFKTLILRFTKVVTCSCFKVISCSTVYRNLLKSKRFHLTDNTKNNKKFRCCNLRLFHLFIDLWDGKTQDLVEHGKSQFMRDYLADILKMSSDFQKLFEAVRYCDATAIIPGGNVQVHRCILSARSPVFQRMFESDMREKTEREVHIVDFEIGIIKKLFEFIYTGKVSFLENAETIQLAYAADKYEAITLKTMCLDYLSSNIDKDSALEICILFDHLHAKDEIITKAQQYIKDSFCAVCDKGKLEEWKIMNPELYFGMFKRTCTCSSS